MEGKDLARTEDWNWGPAQDQWEAEARSYEIFESSDGRESQEEVMSRPENVAAVRHVADALVERRTLTYAEVVDMVKAEDETK